MSDLDLLVIGAMVTFLAVAGAYVAIRHRANDEPVRSYKPGPHSYTSPENAYAHGDDAPRPPASPADTRVS
jgi:hypothetical protein